MKLTPTRNIRIIDVQTINAARATRWHGGTIKNWSGLEWAGAMCGEAGEAANIAKQLRRIETGLAGNAHSEHPLEALKLKAELAYECADTFLYLLLLCEHYGIDLASATRDKFNSKSLEMGFPERI